ncbi:hypothetical protein MAPG_11400 [Magnaporthiopsis poae ATCC 64411]|uniref:GLEYA adhesin domain-containing protein n=1 Tax=Magnaporthiopsis poae (strain ATCC 64411 / 73-15) TaxID=644358 RepID=A0A0C4EF66_MAGP6|nr:hypothetical protein MAPG_11400 [Magnaporthiopsis poae ATCC 64411]
MKASFSVVVLAFTGTLLAAPTTIAPPHKFTCTPGVEWAAYRYCDLCSESEMLHKAGTLDINHLDLRFLLPLRAPASHGVTSRLFAPQLQSPSTSRSVYGRARPTGRNTLVNHRGYLRPSKDGVFRLRVTGAVGDTLVFWHGDKAKGAYSVANADYRTNSGAAAARDGWRDDEYRFEVAAGEIVPFRVIWSNGRNGDGLEGVRILDSDESVVLGAFSLENDQVVTSCSGEGAPEGAEPWGRWEVDLRPVFYPDF